MDARAPAATGLRIDAWLRPGRLRAHAALLALCLWGVFAAGISTPGLRDRSGLLKGSDFLQFYVFGSLARDDRAQSLYDYSAHVAEAVRRVPESRGTSLLPVYGPQVALFFAPLAALPYGTALAAWLLASALLYALCIAAVFRTCPRLAPHGRTTALLALAYPPLFSLIGHGQSSALALACFSAAWLGLRAGRPFAAGLALGCLAYKPQLALGAGLVLLASGEVRILAGAALAATAQFAWAAFGLGGGALASYAGVVARLGDLAPTLGFKLHQMHCLRAFFDLLAPAPVARAAWAVCAVAALALARRAWCSALPLSGRFAALLLATALVNPHQYMYDLVVLAPAWLLLADLSLARPEAHWNQSLRPALRGLRLACVRAALASDPRAALGVGPGRAPRPARPSGDRGRYPRNAPRGIPPLPTSPKTGHTLGGACRFHGSRRERKRRWGVETVDPIELARSSSPGQPIEPLPDPVEQWLRWEEQANLVGFRISTKPVELAVAAVAPGLVSVEASSNAPDDVVQRFLRGESVLFPRHPLNRDPSVSFFDEPVAERWWCRFTSSRTLVVPVGPGESLFSLKLATDHPHPDFRQPEKTRLREEADWSMDWCGPVDRIDALLGPDPGIRMVREIVALVVRGSETACLVRDLRLFQDGHHYLPALSLPWVGRQIARRFAEPFAEFWGRHYAAPVGRAKARIFARYGLWYETPNPQNVLVQLDRDLWPTGVLVFRDLGDTYCATDAFEARDTPWTRLRTDVRPETATSFWAFGECGERSVGAPVLADWYARHDRAYFAELADHFPEAAPAVERSDELAPAWSRALRGPEGERAIAAGFERRMAAARR